MQIIRINKYRWMIEDLFRLLKQELSARPVYLQREERIKAHFLICFIALILIKIIEQKLEYDYNPAQIIKSLNDMELVKINDNVYKTLGMGSEISRKTQSIFSINFQHKYILPKLLTKILKEANKNVWHNF